MLPSELISLRVIDDENDNENDFKIIHDFFLNNPIFITCSPSELMLSQDIDNADGFENPFINTHNFEISNLKNLGFKLERNDSTLGVEQARTIADTSEDTASISEYEINDRNEFSDDQRENDESDTFDDGNTEEDIIANTNFLQGRRENIDAVNNAMPGVYGKCQDYFTKIGLFERYLRISRNRE
ncbi:hypothetical protein BDQ17DRAFT_340781 [Cyathus striatus]|nr:hypothetical protein BDQ17DRAFT_340781 [Cyathus striatus]